MHEGTIAKAIIETINKEMVSRQLSCTVEKIFLCTGKMNQVIPESLRFYFDILKKEHKNLSEALIDIKDQPLVVFCKNCDKAYELAEPSFLCIECKKPVSIKSGKDIYIKSVVLKESLPAQK